MGALASAYPTVASPLLVRQGGNNMSVLCTAQLPSPKFLPLIQLRASSSWMAAAPFMITDSQPKLHRCHSSSKPYKKPSSLFNLSLNSLHWPYARYGLHLNPRLYIDITHPSVLFLCPSRLKNLLQILQSCHFCLIRVRLFFNRRESLTLAYSSKKNFTFYLWLVYSHIGSSSLCFTEGELHLVYWSKNIYQGCSKVSFKAKNCP